MNEVLNIVIDICAGGLIPLAAVMFVNILLGTYYNISVNDLRFDKLKLLDGIKKALIVGVSFIVLAATIGYLGIGGELVSPNDIINAAIIIYSVKSLDNLMGIFGVKLTKKTHQIGE